jgi:hypothetical protein
MTQLFALIWLKWRLFLNSTRSRRSVENSIARLLGTVIALMLAAFVAAALGAGAWLEASSYSRGEAGRLAAPPLIFLAHTAIFVMWAVVPLSTRGGSQFNPGRMLLYPVTLRKLFALDLLSELTSLSSIFAVPAMFALAIGAGIGRGNVWMSLPVAFLTTAFGISLAKWLSTSIGALMRKRRTRAETLLALVGAVFGLGSAAAGQLLPYMTERAGALNLRGLRWTPPGAAAVALLDGLGAGGAGDYAVALLTLAVYTVLTIYVTYWIARRSALSADGGGGAAKRASSKRARAIRGAGQYAGWRLPFLSTELSAVIEKEVRYAMRNAQLRAVALMPLILIVMKLAQTSLINRRGRKAHELLFYDESFGLYGEGLLMACGVLYVFMILSSLVCNLFAYEGEGMRTLILAPVERRTILIGKNITLTLIALLISTLLIIINELVFRDLTTGALGFAALSFVIYAALFMLVGNWLSMRYPRRLQFGKRLNASGVAGLLVLPILASMAALPVVAAVAGYLAQSLLVKYATLALFAGGSLSLYFLLITRQGHHLAQREQEILEAVVSSQ